MCKLAVSDIPSRFIQKFCFMSDIKVFTAFLNTSEGYPHNYYNLLKESETDIIKILKECEEGEHM